MEVVDKKRKEEAKEAAEREAEEASHRRERLPTQGGHEAVEARQSRKAGRRPKGPDQKMSSLDLFKSSEIKKFCCSPYSKMKMQKESAMTVCGECISMSYIRCLKDFATLAVEEHNWECIVDQQRYLEEARDDPVNEGVPDHELMDDYEPVKMQDNEHEKIAKTMMVMEELGIMTCIECNEEDGMYDIEEFHDVIDDIDFSDLTHSDLKDILRNHDIPIRVKSRVSFAKGAGIKSHVAKTGHDVDCGKM